MFNWHALPGEMMCWYDGSMSSSSRGPLRQLLGARATDSMHSLEHSLFRIPCSCIYTNSLSQTILNGYINREMLKMRINVSKSNTKELIIYVTKIRMLRIMVELISSISLAIRCLSGKINVIVQVL